MIVDAREHVGEPRLRIDVVEPRSLDQRVHHGGTFAAAIGAGEQPRLAAERDAAQRTLGSIVGQTNPPVVEEAREDDPTLEHVVHRLGDVVVARELGALLAHPALEIGHEWRDAVTPRRDTLTDGATVDLALDVEDRIDALDRLDRERRKDRQLAARLGGDVGELKELAPAVRPAGCFCDRSWLSVGGVEPIEPGIGIGLQDACIVAQMALRMLGSAVARIEEHRGRRSGACERFVIAHVGP